MKPKFLACAAVLLAAPMLSANTAGAQADRRVAFFAGATGVGMQSEWGNYLAGAQVTASVGTSQGRRIGGVLGARVIVPAGGASATPDCLPNYVCRSYYSPHLLAGYSASLRLNAAANRLRLLAGGGYLHTSGMKGSDHNHSPILQGELQYRILPAKRVSPLASLTVMHLSHSFAGARQIVLASFGVEF